MTLRRWRWARREIRRLDPAVDFHRLSYLSFVVRYGTPIFLHGLFSVAFVYNVGMPEMAKILHRDGRGPILRDTRKRNFDSLTFFGEIYRYGDSEPTQRIAERLIRIHSNFPIRNEMSLYTLATLACLPQRLSDRYLGSFGLTKAECEAQFQFWRRIGELMQLHDIPDTAAGMSEWMRNFEENEFTPTRECRAIARALAQEWADYWFPKWLQPTAIGVFYALIEPCVRDLLKLPAPTVFQNALTTLSVRVFFWASAFFPIPRPVRSAISLAVHTDRGPRSSVSACGTTPPNDPKPCRPVARRSPGSPASKRPA